MALQTATPYMLRNDGKLLECCDIHPYIKYHYENSNKQEVYTLFTENWEYFIWFYNNTNNDTTRKNLKQLIIEDNFSHFISDEEGDIAFLGPISESDWWHLTEEEFYDLYELCNNECNQEFCRVRTSSMRYGGTSGDIYFRISSVGFDWFNLIWKVVYDNRDFITTVTVCTDTQSRGGRAEPYRHGSVVIDRLPVQEFITLSGNPVLEELDFFIERLLASGLSLDESFDLHPRKVNQIVKQLWRKQLIEKFGAKEK